MARHCGSFEGRLPLDPAITLFGPEAPKSQYFEHNDTYVDTNGCVYRQLFQDIPALAPFYMQFEKDFDAWAYGQFAERYFVYAWIICAVYLLFLVVGTRVMKDRTKFDLKPALKLWNLALSVFSAIGFLRTAPHLLYYLYKNGFYASVCMPGEPSYGQGAAGLWTMLFIYSKIPELGDTVFIVLRKSNLIFLHWYHHVTVLLYCWHSYATRSSTGLYFIAMNYGVHAIMYFYFFLSASGIRVKWDKIVTTLQISQMFVGMAICAAVYYFHSQGLTCDVRPDNYAAGLLMYASYAALFIIFAVEKYIWGKSSLEAAKRPAVKDAAAAAKKQDPEVSEDPRSESKADSNLKQRKVTK